MITTIISTASTIAFQMLSSKVPGHKYLQLPTRKPRAEPSFSHIYLASNFGSVFEGSHSESQRSSKSLSQEPCVWASSWKTVAEPASRGLKILRKSPVGKALRPGLVLKCQTSQPLGCLQADPTNRYHVPLPPSPPLTVAGLPETSSPWLLFQQLHSCSVPHKSWWQQPGLS